ncbi:MAG TPA: EamA family transporter [Acidimicrobiia bacterium]
MAFALVSAALYGSADFAGGMAVRRNGSTFGVVFVTQLVGLVGIAIVAPIYGASHVTLSDFAWGAAAGICGGVGLALFYRALALGTMSVVSPVTGVVSAAVPVGVGLLLGERPSIAAAIGIVLAIAAVAMFGGGASGAGDGLAKATRALMPAILAGAGFGGFFSLLAETHHGAGLWPIVSARLAACLLYLVASRVRRAPLRVRTTALAITVAAGVGDVLANAVFLTAARHGDLAIVGVIGALYPASTLVLARVVLDERLVVHQRVALAVAALAVVLIAIA